jgi:hypothetical protein
VRADHAPRGGRGGECGTAKRRRKFGRNWIGASASACGGVLPAAVVGRPEWRRSRQKGRQSYTLCEREWRTGAAATHGGPASNCVGMPDVFVQCICVSRGSSTCEQENPEVREGVGIANQFGPIGFSHKFTTSSSSYSSPIARARPQHLKITQAKPTTVTTDHRKGYPSSHSLPTTIPRQASSSPDEPLQFHLAILPTLEPRHH